MQMNEENKNILVNFISQKIGEGETIDQIKTQLIQMGFSNEDINLAYLVASTNKSSISPLPFSQSQQNFGYANNINKNIKEKTDDKNTVKAGETAINILSFVALGFVISSFITLCFTTINYIFKDVISDSSYYSDKYTYQTINYAVAVILVAFPIYFFSARFWLSVFRKDPDKKEDGLTKFVTYLVLIFSIIVLAGDLVTIIYNFLQGELSARFFLKALTILITACFVFGFYFFERKRVQYKKDVPSVVFYAFGIIFVTSIVISMIAAFFVTGSPSTQRKRAFDDIRSENLKDIAYCIKNNYEATTLKNSINVFDDFTMDEIMKNSCSNLETSDPVTKEKYEIKFLKDDGLKDGKVNMIFQTCANFDLSTLSNDEIKKENSSISNNIDYLKHSAGKYCFKNKIEIMIGSNKNSSNDSSTSMKKYLLSVGLIYKDKNDSANKNTTCELVSSGSWISTTHSNNGKCLFELDKPVQKDYYLKIWWWENSDKEEKYSICKFETANDSTFCSEPSL